MGEELYRAYLTFLGSMSKGLVKLTELSEKQYAAARTDDLAALDELVHQEQAQALNFRGLELTRNKLLPQLGLEGVPMSRVPDRFPAALREEAREAVTEVQDRYRDYRRISAKARTLLQRNLSEVEHAIQAMGGSLNDEPVIPGYQKRESEIAPPPPGMKTDFRA